MNPIKSARWTIGLTALLFALNLRIIPASVLQYDRAAIDHGQLWRLLTGNLTHWSPEHFLLDAAAFLVIGLLYERFLGRWYPLLLLAIATAVGVGLRLFAPDLALYRGLSGVDSGLFAAALVIEFPQARQQPQRWLWTAPAAILFLMKIAFECGTGRMFFGTDSLGDLGMPTPLAHAIGAAVGVMLAAAIVIPSQREISAL